MSDAQQKHPVTELFRFARVTATPVIDIEHRARTRGLPEQPDARQTWARTFLKSERVAVDLSQLAFPFREYLKPETSISDAIPSRASLRDPKAFAAAAIERDPRYQEDLARLQGMLLALSLSGSTADRTQQDDVSRLVQFVEAFPRIGDSPQPRPYAPLVLRRVAKVATPPRPARLTPEKKPASDTTADLVKVAGAVQLLWRARNKYLEQLADAHLAARRARAALPRVPVAAAPAAKRSTNGRTGQPAAKSAAAAAARARAEAERSRANEKVEEARKKYDDAKKEATLSTIISVGAGFMATLPTVAAAGISSAIDILNTIGPEFDIPLGRFCEAYGAAMSLADESGRTPAGLATPIAEITGFAAPTVDFEDSVRVLGKAELVRLDEEFVSYSAGEISYIQTALAGEKRKRKVRSENVMETTTEQLQEETTEAAQETSATTKSELKSQVETELRSRLDSNINASGNASGGGTIGPVDVSGGASFGASVAVGVDAGLRTKTESSFAQEIVQKGLERTTRRTMERRLTRTVQSYWAQDSHEIDNSTGEMLNGTYVFLNKQVAIKETVYGARAFLQGNLIAPGRSLLASRSSRLRAAEDAIGARPMFTITPADITPKNYLQLAGEFRAQGVEPPPAPITTLSRVYKTDTASASSEAEEFNGKKIVDLLVPFFGQYKRYLITDNVEIPEGYEVADVVTAVSHGANGVSIPAHLPFTLPTTAVYAGASFTPFAIGILGVAFLPAWVWSVAYMGSPLLHYNADSSNATITIGTHGQDSSYFFFEPDELLTVISELVQALTAATPDFMDKVKEFAETAITDMGTAAANVPPEIAGRVTTALSDAVNNLKHVLDALANANVPEALTRFSNLPSNPVVDLANLPSLPTIFAPIRQFIADVSGLITTQLGDAIARTFGWLLGRFDNTQNLLFSRAEGTRGRLPVAINTLALKPGVTVTVSACLRRTDEALVRWQLRTFEAFYQSHLQLVAAYENQLYLRNGPPDNRAPGILRREEHTAIKERVLHAINGLRDTTAQSYEIGRLALFEHALDWENMTYRVFNYGPSADQMLIERDGLLAGADDRRRQFLTSTWAEVMVPVQAHAGLEAQLLGYFGDGTGSIDEAVTPGPNEMNELAALYRDLVLSRAFQQPESENTTFATVPTDLVALYRKTLDEELPRNPRYPPPPPS